MKRLAGDWFWSGRTSSSRNETRLLALRGAATLALVVSAFIHIDLAAGPLVADGQITLAGLFIGQAIAAAFAALWVVARGSHLAWLVSGGVGLASLIALVVSVYVLVPSIGPLPAVYEPFWYAEKVVAASAAAVAVVAAVVALWLQRPAESRLSGRVSLRR